MTVEESLFDVLKALVAKNQAYPDEAPSGAPPPYLVYQQVGGEAPTFVERAVPSKENGRFQINAWCKTRKEAKALIKQVEAAMVAATAFDAKPLSAPIALSDDDTQLRGASQDFTVWSDR